MFKMHKFTSFQHESVSQQHVTILTKHHQLLTQCHRPFDQQLVRVNSDMQLSNKTCNCFCYKQGRHMPTMWSDQSSTNPHQSWFCNCNRRFSGLSSCGCGLKALKCELSYLLIRPTLFTSCQFLIEQTYSSCFYIVISSCP